MAARQTNTPSVVFTLGPLWQESLISAIKDTPMVVKKIDEFRRYKEQNPLAPFGSSDKAFNNAGIYSKYLPKARKAHLTPDISIVYELRGRNPTDILLYGVFTHADLGTGQPANKNVQKNMAKRLALEQIENFLIKLIGS